LLIDISPVLDSTIGVWPGDAAVEQKTAAEIRMSLHAGAHVDAPMHIRPEGDDIATAPLDPYLGRCVVIDVRARRGQPVTPHHIEGKPLLAPRVLFRTRTFRDWRSWNDDFAFLSPELITVLYDHGVTLVGIDTPSIDSFRAEVLMTHIECARSSIAVLEGLVLDHVEEGEYELIALPLRIRGADASPVRAVLRTL
jgi:arylformamidase